jgi:hypothetical protein
VSRIMRVAIAAVGMVLAVSAVALAAIPGTDVRLTRDDPADMGGGYMSDYTLVTGRPYSDATLAECTRSRGRENEPAVAIDPRQAQVIVGSSNDYCGVYNTTVDGVPVPAGPIWLGYYRSENGGASFQSSLVPGYPGDTSPYASRARIRTASSGDPVLAWDKHGRLFAGSESSDDPAGTKKTFGDEWVATYENPGGVSGNPIDDGKEFKRSVIVAKGSSAPSLLGKFNDKTAIEADRTNSACEGNVYFAWSLYNGNGGNTIDFSRSTDHGQTFSKGINLGPVNSEIQGPDIAITGNGHVYVTFRQFSGAKKNVADAVLVTKSTDCGRTFSPPRRIRTFTPYDASDVPDPEEATAPSSGPAEEPMDDEVEGGGARDCGSLDAHCASNYVFFRRDTQVRSTADQNDTGSEDVYIVYDPTIPGTEVPTGTTYGSVGTGTGSQSGVYFIRYNGATGSSTAPAQIDPQDRGHQLFPDVAVDAGTLHALWWDSRNDPAYSPQRPIGNFADGTQSAGALDVYASTSSNRGASWTASTRLTDVASNPNWEQFSDRTVPFAGDYLWIDAQGGQTFGVWTDWRNTVAGTDPREPASDMTGADVKQCRAAQSDGTWGPDTCPRAGGLDQDIYGDHTP